MVHWERRRRWCRRVFFSMALIAYPAFFRRRALYIQPNAFAEGLVAPFWGGLYILSVVYSLLHRFIPSRPPEPHVG